MNSVQEFRYTGAAGTCLWCGRKLPKPGSSRAMAPYRGGGHFDVESCATQFGARAAALGFRLQRQARPEELAEARRVEELERQRTTNQEDK